MLFRSLCRQGWFWTSLILGLVALHIYSLGFIGATRSVLLSVLTALIFSVFGLSYRLSNGVLTTKSSLRQPRRLVYLLLFVGIFLLFAIFFINFEQLFELFQNNLIFERIFNPDSATQRSSELRIEEAIGGIQSFQDEIEFLFGKGLGSTFFSVLGYEINAFHIGVLTFLLKGGLIMFSFVVFIVYIKLPQLFVKSLLNPHAFNPLRRTALLVVLPGVFGWAVLLLISGGYSMFNSLGIGFAFGAYLHIKKYGLGIFFE